MGERGPEFFSSHTESSLESDGRELARHPWEVVDSPLDAALKQHRLTAERIAGNIGVERHLRNVDIAIELGETRSTPPSFQIAWPIDSQHAMLLDLAPMSEGRGPESGTFGYTGRYGLAKPGKKAIWKFTSEAASLEQLYGVPSGLHLIVMPTVTRWAVAKETEVTSLYGENARTLYMGIGLLLLGHQWMHIGFHEAGHLPDTNDEIEAWQKGNSKYAIRHVPEKKYILSGKSKGLFDILDEPQWNPRKPTIGEIMKYGLAFPWSEHGPKIPDTWRRDAEKIQRKFTRVIEEAHEAFEQGLR